MTVREFDEQRGIGRFQEVQPLSTEIITSLEIAAFPPLRQTSASCKNIEIAGTTFGIGKSAAAEVLVNMLTGFSIEHHPERWWDNPNLQDPEKRFQSELCFLELKARDNGKTREYPPSTLVIQEVPSESDFLFAAVDDALGNLTPEEFLSYTQLYDVLFSAMVAPDLIVLLHCGDLEDPFGTDFEEIFKRIERRDRGQFELDQAIRTMALDYLTKRFLRAGGWGKTPVLPVNTKSLDFANDYRGKLELAGMVVQKAKEVAPEKFADLKVK